MNKSVRPIIITSYGFHIVNQKDQGLALWIQPANLHPGTRFNTPLPVKLQDGDSCSAFYSITNLKKELNNNNIILPIKIKGVMNTTDGLFTSIEKELTEEILKS